MPPELRSRKLKDQDVRAPASKKRRKGKAPAHAPLSQPSQPLPNARKLQILDHGEHSRKLRFRNIPGFRDKLPSESRDGTETPRAFSTASLEQDTQAVKSRHRSGRAFGGEGSEVQLATDKDGGDHPLNLSPITLLDTPSFTALDDSRVIEETVFEPNDPNEGVAAPIETVALPPKRKFPDGTVIDDTYFEPDDSVYADKDVESPTAPAKLRFKRKFPDDRVIDDSYGEEDSVPYPGEDFESPTATAVPEESAPPCPHHCTKEEAARLYAASPARSLSYRGCALDDLDRAYCIQKERAAKRGRPILPLSEVAEDLFKFRKDHKEEDIEVRYLDPLVVEARLAWADWAWKAAEGGLIHYPNEQCVSIRDQVR